jgi:hypothetical protein
MYLTTIFTDYGAVLIITLFVFSFVAGFIDAIGGGGGLIQLPALLIAFPKIPMPTIFGTNKIPSFAGTAISAFQYAKRVKFNYTLLILISISAGIASYSGARFVSYVDINKLKPLVLIVLVVIAAYTFLKKDFGSAQTKNLSTKRQYGYGVFMGMLVGFYDGFFGPGTGSLFMLCFVVVLGFDFVQASAYSKLINCITNLSALIVFIRQGHYILELAIPLAVCNISGNWIGPRLAIQKGNKFIRVIFLMIVTLMILRYGYDVFIKK